MITIRKAVRDDSTTIALFQQKLAGETENLDLDPAILLNGILAVFDDPSRGQYYIAEVDENIVSCLLTTYEWSDWRNGYMIWIQSVYVKEKYRRRGIFKRMYDLIKQKVASDPGLMGIRLYVDASNEAAMKAYLRCGMDGEHYRLFEWIKEP